MKFRVESEEKERGAFTLRLLLAWRAEDTAEDDAAATWDVADGAAEDISDGLVENCDDKTPTAGACLFGKYISVISTCHSSWAAHFYHSSARMLLYMPWHSAARLLYGLVWQKKSPVRAIRPPL